MTRDDLLAIMPYAKPRIAAFFSPLVDAMDRFEINTPARQAAFIAQIAHESSSFASVSENLNYSPEGLMATFNNKRVTRFTKSDAYRYGRTAEHPADQESIANIAYAGRMGNGPMESGDGWRHRGAGLIQLTGKENHIAVSLYFDIPLEDVGDWLRSPAGACLSAGWFWKTNRCNEYADAGDFDAISDAINIGRQTATEGDAIGYPDRLVMFKKAQAVLA